MNKVKIEPLQSWDQLLAALRTSVFLAGGEDAKLWQTVEDFGGTIMNTTHAYFSYEDKRPGWQSRLHREWQGAARAYLGYKMMGVEHDPGSFS